jgi:hypothetical protein
MRNLTIQELEAEVVRLTLELNAATNGEYTRQDFELEQLRSELATSPELLELARRIEWLATAGTERGGVPYMITDGDWFRLWEQARAAISKATGV